MSTSIDELPGPLPEEYLLEEEEEEENINDNDNGRTQNFNIHGYPDENQQRKIEKYEDNNNKKSNINIEIKRKSKQLSYFQIISKELNEENLLIFGILLLACLPQVTEYIVHFIMITPLKDFFKSSISVSLFKCFLLLVLFLIIKNYILI